MKKFIDIVKVFVFVFVLVETMLTSCVKETLCELTHPHTAGVTFNYNWSNVESLGIKRPSNMFILFDRVIYQEMFCVDYNAYTGLGHYVSVPDSASEEQRSQLVGAYSTYTVNSSFYKFITVNSTSDVFDTSALQAYFNSRSKDVLPDLTLPYKTYKASEIILGKNTPWYDYNDYNHPDGTSAGFVFSNVEPIVIDSTTVGEIPQGTTVQVDFTPSILTHSIDLSFDLQKDQTGVTFVVDSVYAIISGIPHSVSLRSGAIDISNTNKILTKFNSTDSGSRVHCTKNLNVIGIVENSNMDQTRYNGPGVMQLIIFCRINPDASNEQKKTLNGLVNIHNALKAAGLQAYSYEKDCWIKSGYYTSVPIQLNITINKKMLIGDASEGIPEWDDGADIGSDV